MSVDNADVITASPTESALSPDSKLPLPVQPAPITRPQETFDVEEAQSERSPLRIFAVMSALYLVLFIAALDLTVVTTALPTIANHFQSAAGYTWVGAAYVLADTASGPVWTNVSEIYGRKAVLLVSVVLFMASSLICALSTSMGMLITGRALQGTAAGAMTLLVYIVISDLFDMRRRSLYMGASELVWALSGAVGPIIGGGLAEFNWRWIWYMNLPICGLSFIILLLFLDVHNPKTPVWAGLKAVDWLGSLALLAVTLMTLLGLNIGGESFDWTSPPVLVLITAGVACSVLFFLIEAKAAKYPVMPLGVFKSSSNSATIAIKFFHAFASGGPEYYLPLFFQSAKLARPLRSGLLGLPYIFLEAVGGLVCGIIIHYTGRYNTLIWIGVLSMTLGTGLLIDLKPSSGLGKIIVYQAIGALGSGFLLQAPLIAMQANVSQRDTATATATLQFIRGLGLTISVVIGSVVFQSSMNLKKPELLDAGLLPRTVMLFSGEGAQANVDKLRSMPNVMNRELVQAAYAWSLRNAWIMYTGLSFLTIVAAWFVGTHPLSTEHTETRTGLDDRESEKS